MLIEAKDLVEALTKHLPGLHDQRSHGRRHVRHWEPMIDEQAYRTLRNRFFADPEAIRALLDNHDAYVVDGLLCLVEHPDREHFGPDDTSRPITPEMADHFLSTVHRLQTTNPIDTKFIVHLTEAPFQAFGYARISRRSVGSPDSVCRLLGVRPASVTMTETEWKILKKSLSVEGWLMPAGSSSSRSTTCSRTSGGTRSSGATTLSRRHACSPRPFATLNVTPAVPCGLSGYGTQTRHEGYAESFAQWVLAGWEPSRLAEDPGHLGGLEVLHRRADRSSPTGPCFVAATVDE